MWVRHKWLGRFALAILAPLLLLVLAEALLHLVGYGYPVSFFIPSDADTYVTNQKFAWQFFGPGTALKPFLFTLSKHKPAGTFRICILGESAAMGTPDPAFSFGRILEAGLRRNFPETKFEIVNAAMRGINSHVIRKIARECASHDMDLFIIYMGNNEMIGLHSPTPGTPLWTQSLLLIRASELVKASKLGQLFGSVLVQLSAGSRPTIQDMAYFRRQALRADDARRQKVYANFRANLDEICRTVEHTGAKALLCTVAVNLRDFPPLVSMLPESVDQQQSLAWQKRYAEAASVESSGAYPEALQRFSILNPGEKNFAELFFRLGRCYLAAADHQKAREQFQLACDWDALQFRTDSRLNRIIREVAGLHESRGVTLVDTERLVAQSDSVESGIPGTGIFYDHVHPTFSGNYLLARSCYERIPQASSPFRNQPSRPRFPIESDCAHALAFTESDELEVTAAFLKLSAKPPFLGQLEHSQRQAQGEALYQARLAAFTREKAEACIRVYLEAISEDPLFWPLRFNLAALYEQVGRAGSAADQYRSVVNQFPEVKRFRMALANALLAAGDKPGALTQLKEAARLDTLDRALKEQVKSLE